MDKPLRILVICTGNSARSQMAEGLFRHLGGERVQVFSAGSEPSGAVHLLAVRAMAKVDGAEDAAAQLAWFQELCNDVWRRRAEITPRYERQRLLGPLDVYRLLPQLNCQACGEATCMAFAFGLLQSRHAVQDCPVLCENEAFADRYAQLAALIYRP